MKNKRPFFITSVIISFIFIFTACNSLTPVKEPDNLLTSKNDKSPLELTETEGTPTASGSENNEYPQNAAKSELIPPNAYDINTLGSLVTYNSPDTPEQILDWYETVKGWSLETKTDTVLIKIFSLSNNTEAKVISVSAGENGGAMVVISED